jgi:DNA-binding NarL/FixJ family response regulator
VDRQRSGLDVALADVDAMVVDLTARSYDAIAAIERASAAGLRILAVGQHDDAALRKRALAAGAERVYAYRKLFEDGPATLVAWLGAETLGIQKRYG